MITHTRRDRVRAGRPRLGLRRTASTPSRSPAPVPASPHSIETVPRRPPRPTRSATPRRCCVFAMLAGTSAPTPSPTTRSRSIPDAVARRDRAPGHRRRRRPEPAPGVHGRPAITATTAAEARPEGPARLPGRSPRASTWSTCCTARPSRWTVATALVVLRSPARPDGLLGARGDAPPRGRASAVSNLHEPADRSLAARPDPADGPTPDAGAADRRRGPWTEPRHRDGRPVGRRRDLVAWAHPGAEPRPGSAGLGLRASAVPTARTPATAASSRNPTRAWTTVPTGRAASRSPRRPDRAAR